MEIINHKQSRRPKDQTDKEYLIYQKGFKSGKEHQHSAPETRIALKNLMDEINDIKVSIAGSDAKLDSIASLLKNHIADEEKYRDKQDVFHKELYAQKADKKEVEELKTAIASKAGSWVGGVLIWGGGAIGLAIIGAVMQLILRK